MTSPQVHPNHTYTVIPRVLIFPEYEGRLLLLKGAPTKPLWPNYYNGLGGHVEPGETVHQAAVRELEEEAGIVSDDLLLCGMVNITLAQPQPGVMLFIFACHAPSAQMRPGKEGDLAWFSWDTLPVEHMVPDLPELLSHVRRATADQRPFYALYTYDQAGNMQTTFIG